MGNVNFTSIPQPRNLLAAQSILRFNLRPKLHHRLTGAQVRQPQLRQAASRPVVMSSRRQPAYNKYKSRQSIERDYYRDWERTTLIAKEDVDRPMTILTFLRFLPIWFRFHGLPGPVRYMCYLAWQRAAAVGHKIHKRLVMEGAKLDSSLIRRANLPQGTLSRKMVLLRYHHRISALENAKFRVALLFGKPYLPKVTLLPVDHFVDPREDMKGYDPTWDPLPVA